jgi:hypothetical protein
MQPRRCARFEGSERSPTSLWSHYTMVKLKRESRRFDSNITFGSAIRMREAK